jgi:hypothetical protein
MTVMIGVDAPAQTPILQTADLSGHQTGGTVIFIEASDTRTLDDTLAAIHLVEGWAGLTKVLTRNEARVGPWVNPKAATFPSTSAVPRIRQDANIRARDLPGANTVASDTTGLAALKGGLARFAAQVQQALDNVEVAARASATRRLAESRAEIETESQRYLTGFDDTIFADTQTTLVFPTGTALRTDKASQPDISSLRSSVAELQTLEAKQVQAAATALAALITNRDPALALAAALPMVARSSRTIARESLIRAERAELHPVLYHLDVTPIQTAVSDKDLVDYLTTTFADVWQAQAAVNAQNAATILRPDDTLDYEQGPARVLGTQLKKLGFGQDAGPLARLNPEPVGPWAYPSLIEETVGDLTGPGHSLTRRAVTDVYAATGAEPAAAFQELAATMGALLLLHKVCLPLAVLADVTLAAKGIYEAIAAHVLKTDAWRCTLDPADSFGVEPSALRVALEVAGELAGVIPGGQTFGRPLTTFSVLAPFTAAMLP